MSNWTTIPPWLYRNDLPDDELQERYVEAAEKKWRALVAEREVLEDELWGLRDRMAHLTTIEELEALAAAAGELGEGLEEARRVETAAKAFLADARRVLARYRPRKPLRG